MVEQVEVEHARHPLDVDEVIAQREVDLLHQAELAHRQGEPDFVDLMLAREIGDLGAVGDAAASFGRGLAFGGVDAADLESGGVAGGRAAVHLLSGTAIANDKHALAVGAGDAQQVEHDAAGHAQAQQAGQREGVPVNHPQAGEGVGLVQQVGQQNADQPDQAPGG